MRYEDVSWVSFSTIDAIWRNCINSGKIASIDAKICPPKAHGYLEEELKCPAFIRSKTAKRSKILEQPSETLLYNSGLDILFGII